MTKLLLDPIFLKYANMAGDNDCWLWTGPLTKGYGRTELEGEMWQAHRYSYTKLVGLIPDGMYLCHNCPGGDNRACVNPGHLFIGTSGDNNKDTAKKGHSMKGERNNRAKLTEENIREIRALRSSGETLLRIANKYGVTEALVSYIARRVIWSHVV